MILLAFRHGLRAAEACDLRWDQVEFDAAVLHVRRVKNGTPSTHPLIGDEMRALRRLHRESEPSPFVFVSERGSPFTTAGFARMIERAAASAGLDLKAHPHMLRHACAGHDACAENGDRTCHRDGANEGHGARARDGPGDDDCAGTACIAGITSSIPIAFLTATAAVALSVERVKDAILREALDRVWSRCGPHWQVGDDWQPSAGWINAALFFDLIGSLASS